MILLFVARWMILLFVARWMMLFVARWMMLFVARWMILLLFFVARWMRDGGEEAVAVKMDFFLPTMWNYSSEIHEPLIISTPKFLL